MKNDNSLFGSAQIGATVLGILGILLVVAVLTGRKIPLVSGDRQAFIVLVILGFGMCTMTMGTNISALGWTHWSNIAGSALGVLLIALTIAVIAGIRLPFIPSERIALLVLAGVLYFKYALSFVARMV